MASTSSTATIDQEAHDFNMVTRATPVIIMPDVCTRGTIIQTLAARAPQNEYGLPQYYFRSDLLDIPAIIAQGSVLEEVADAAVEVLQYADGYPTIAQGTPFWRQLAHEPRKEYILFESFIELDELEGIRMLDSLAVRENVPLEYIQELSKEYYWSARARAYDLFIVAAEAKRREVRTRKMEASHFDVAGSILDTVVQRINSEPDLIEKMDAKDLFDLFEQMVKIQRLSLGLTGANSSSTQKELNNPGQSIEFILRNITKNAGVQESSQEVLQNRLRMLMQDPETAMSAQELIIRATSGN